MGRKTEKEREMTRQKKKVQEPFLRGDVTVDFSTKARRAHLL